MKTLTPGMESIVMLLTILREDQPELRIRTIASTGPTATVSSVSVRFADAVDTTRKPPSKPAFW